MNRNVKRVIDNLSLKYEFFYLVKTNKKKSTLIFLLYFLFVTYVVFDIYRNDSTYGIVSNIFPFFVDIAIVFAVTVIFLIIRAVYNDEGGRIVENDITTKIETIVPLNIDFCDIDLQLDRTSFYSQPKELEALLNWVDFDKAVYFRTHYGSLDIPKIALDALALESGRLKLYCSLTSFFDITFTHYFPDYSLSSSGTTSQEKVKSLRSMLSSSIESHYKKIESYKNDRFDFFKPLPNPLGITGIVELSIEGEKSLFILQRRYSADAAAKEKIQHSFAGTIDLFPRFYNAVPSLEEMVNTELYDEVLEQSVDADVDLKLLETSDKVRRENTLLGLAVNPLYLYQPEMFVKVRYIIPRCEELSSLIDWLIKEERLFSGFLKRDRPLPKTKSNLYVCSRDSLNAVRGHKKIFTRNLFPVGLVLLEQNETQGS